MGGETRQVAPQALCDSGVKVRYGIIWNRTCQAQEGDVCVDVPGQAETAGALPVYGRNPDAHGVCAGEGQAAAHGGDGRRSGFHGHCVLRRIVCGRAAVRHGARGVALRPHAHAPPPDARAFRVQRRGGHGGEPHAQEGGVETAARLSDAERRVGWLVGRGDI